MRHAQALPGFEHTCSPLQSAFVQHVPSAMQSDAHWYLPEAHPHWYEMHNCVDGHEPQESVAPHPLSSVPHSALCSAQVVGVHPQWLSWHVPWPQLPHDRLPPQPSATLPHSAPTDAHVTGVQPHWLLTPPPPHVCGGEQSPHATVAPQPSEMTPHDAPVCAQLFGMQGASPHTFGPPPPQLCPTGQVPHSTTPPQPSGAEPHDAPSCAQVLGEHPPPSTPPSDGAPSTPASGFGFAGGEASAPASLPHERAIGDSAAATAPERSAGARRGAVIARIK